MTKKQLLKHLPPDGCLLIFSGPIDSWRKAGLGVTIRVCEYMLPRPGIRDFRVMRRVD